MCFRIHQRNKLVKTFPLPLPVPRRKSLRDLAAGKNDSAALSISVVTFLPIVFNVCADNAFA